MTDLRKAAEMALEALESVYGKGKRCEAAIEALRQALAQDALKTVVDIDHSLGLFVDSPSVDAVNMSQERVDETAKGEHEPVAYLDEGLGAFYWPNEYKKDVGFTPLYAGPPHRWSNVTDDALMHEVRHRGFVIRDAQVGKKWVGLTDEDKQEAFDETQEASGGFWEFADYLEAKLKEKNT